MSVARHHAEWLSLLEISGPFMSMPVLMRAFPQGLDAHDSELAQTLRIVYGEWLDNQRGLQPEPAIHRVWIEWVLRHVLEMPAEVILGSGLDGHKADHSSRDGLSDFAITVAEYAETIHPDLAIVEPKGDGERDSRRAARLLIQILPPDQDLEKPLAQHHWLASPATRMMTLLHATGVRLGLVTNGERWMLVDAPEGETTGFTSWYAELWLDEPLTLRSLRSLLSAHRFFGVADKETIEALLAASANDQQEVTDQLGYQIRRAVEMLVQAIDVADQNRQRALLTGIPDERLYEAAVTVMMRLVFLLCAEERELLLLDDPVYDQHYAVSTLRAQLQEIADLAGEEVLEHRHDAWDRLLAIFRVVYGGLHHDRLTLPAYGGSLFDPDRFPFLEGRHEGSSWRQSSAQPLPINNRTVLHLLDALQLLQVKLPGGGPAEARRLSFRALDIEQIGHVYEGLLDHTAVRADAPVLGISGTREREPEIPLSVLETWKAKKEEEFVKFLREQTGRSENALRNSLRSTPDLLSAQRVRAACVNDENLYQRVIPFAGLLRDDAYGNPLVIPDGSIYVTSGKERRATGTHYTPRSLTEPIVQHTLEPLVYIGPAEGWPREKWQLHSAADLLDLKICDMAMGSGAFLVQTCRYLSERVVEAWETAEKWNLTSKAASLITVEGNPTDNPDECPPSDTLERLALARRLVTDRCLFGVDKNHLAVEMAKLSIWLVTLDKGRPFTFLDHALKCGDSLLGVGMGQLTSWSLAGEESSQMSWFAFPAQQALDTAIKLRRQIAATTVREVRDAEMKVQLLARTEEAMELVRLGGDLLIASALVVDPKERETMRQDLLARFYLAVTTYKEVAEKRFTAKGSSMARDAIAELRTEADKRLGQHRPFHWAFEFPEVFLQDKRKGFDAFVGNPPFMGGGRISSAFGDKYFRYLRLAYPNVHGQADLCAFFFLRSFAMIQQAGTLGLIATNTIAQADTREAALDFIVEHDGEIYAALSSMQWPGVAAVYVSVVHIIKGVYRSHKTLNEQNVPVISTFLDTEAARKPRALMENAEKAFRGMDVLGMGFTMSQEEAKALISKDHRNSDVLFPYLNGLDLNSRPDQTPSRWVINFFDWSLEKAESYPDCMHTVKEKVYPERMLNNNKQRREVWWRFTRPRVELFKMLAPFRRVLARARVTRTHAFAFVPSRIVYSDALVVFAYDDAANFAVLQSIVHECWAWKYGSTLKSDLRYSPSDCFDTFALPRLLDPHLPSLESVGEAYHQLRHQIMLERQEGLTLFYNRFHDSAEAAADVIRMRGLQVEIDRAVLEAYQWDDLALDHGFRNTALGMRFTISDDARREVLDRLLELNHRRYAEEVKAGLHEKMPGKGKTREEDVDPGNQLQTRMW